MSRSRSTGTVGRLRLRTTTSKWYTCCYLVAEVDQPAEEEHYIRRVAPPESEGREGGPDGRAQGKA